jgi:hypothetical protein
MRPLSDLLTRVTPFAPALAAVVLALVAVACNHNGGGTGY